MTALLAVLYVTGVVMVLDMIRRPSPVWQRADRRKGSWITGGVLSTLFAVGVPFCLVAYVVGVVPRLNGAERLSAGRFSKHSEGASDVVHPGHHP